MVIGTAPVQCLGGVRNAWRTQCGDPPPPARLTLPSVFVADSAEPWISRLGLFHTGRVTHCATEVSGSCVVSPNGARNQRFMDATPNVTGNLHPASEAALRKVAAFVGLKT